MIKEKIRKLLPILFLLCFSASAYSQTAEVITSIINSNQATYGQACYLGAVAKEIVAPDASYDESIAALKRAGFIKVKKNKTALKASDPVDIATVAELCTDIWTIRESVMCELVPIKYYKLRQLKALGIIPAKFDMYMIPSGIELMGIITACAEEFPLQQTKSIGE